jgi:zinc transport system substrate-binding protein
MLFACAILMLASCDDVDRNHGHDNSSETTTGIVVTSNYPLHFFANRIASGIDSAPNIVLPEIEGDPANWIPGTTQIQTLQSADLIIVNGAGAEPWLDWITLDKSRIIDTISALSAELMALNQSAQHRHGPGGDRSHHATAFTVWLDPKLAIDQARAVERALTTLTPAHAAQYVRNLSVLEQELTELDREWSEVFALLRDRPVLFSHPVYEYLQRRYGINGQSVHWEPGEEPSTRDWIDLQQRLASHPANIMIWEAKPLQSTVQRLSNAGLTSVVFETAANKPAQGDYFSLMLQNAQRLQTTFQHTASGSAE